MGTGGYQDPSRFIRLSLAGKKRKAETHVRELRPRLDMAEENVRRFTESLEALHNERRSLQQTRASMRERLAHAAEAVQASDNQLARSADVKRQHQERRDELQSIVAECDAAIEAMETERRTTTLGALGPDEVAR